MLDIVMQIELYGRSIAVSSKRKAVNGKLLIAYILSLTAHLNESQNVNSLNLGEYQ